jgi:non-ribosomal peptide synthetase component E (peptide arylation enzyme)
MPGEISWRGATSSYGFLGDPEANRARAACGGWHDSGDLGQFDTEGYLHIVGRKKDIIIRGGRNINPGKIEEILLRHETVLDVAIVPAPDPVLGEIVCAVVIPKDPAMPPTLDSLNAAITAAGMALWYQPERLVLVEDFPRNAGGKTDKRALAAQVSTLSSGETGA